MKNLRPYILAVYFFPDEVHRELKSFLEQTRVDCGQVPQEHSPLILVRVVNIEDSHAFQVSIFFINNLQVVALIAEVLFLQEATDPIGRVLHLWG